MNIVHLCLSES